MSTHPLRHYRAVWCVDYEYHAPPGDTPVPIVGVALELRSGRYERLVLTDTPPARPPYGTDERTLVVAYYAPAEMGCHLALGWPVPLRILDLYAEFRLATSGLYVPRGHGLLGALAYYNLDAMSAAEKQDMRQLAMRGGPYTSEELAALLAYCQEDVDALARLLPAMLPSIDLPRALLRGRYTAAVARMERAGVPIDTEVLGPLLEHWERIKGRLIAEVDSRYGVFVPTGGRSIDPNTAFGALILEEAARWGVDPKQLADVVNVVWQEERQATAELFEARRAARRATGLHPHVINRWEDAGRDHSEYPGLDAKARELARLHPALGIGGGYEGGTGYDADDYAGRLWGLLRDRDERPKPRTHPDVIRKAAEMVAAHPAAGADHAGPMTFSALLWRQWTASKGIAWPTLPSGALALDREMFKEMARTYPDEVGPMRELLQIHRGELKRIGLTVGKDGRNRYMLSPFKSKTGRNQPSNAASIFGPSAWLRCLIRPGPGMALAYCDWSAQELAIAAALSGDRVMQDAYLSGDPYLFLARKAGAVPADATKQTHAAERAMFKVVSLGVLYGLSADGIARRLDVPPHQGRELLRMHQRTFRRFWEWSDRVEMRAMLTGRLETVFGWRVHVPSGLHPVTGKPLANPRSLRNFPMQANGAEMMRLACCTATEQGVTVCAPIHDALLVEATTGDIDDAVSRTEAAMRKAAEIVLDGFPLRTDRKIVRHPERYSDDRGSGMWETVTGLLADIRGGELSTTEGWYPD